MPVPLGSRSVRACARPPPVGLRLLAALARRPAWLAAMVLSAFAWVGEAASLALAPVPIVATLRNAGRGLLVVGGGRWLDERFSRLEIVGVALASAGGIITAVGAAHSKVVRKPLSNWTEIILGAVVRLGGRAGRRPCLPPGGGPRRAPAQGGGHSHGSGGGRSSRARGCSPRRSATVLPYTGWAA